VREPRASDGRDGEKLSIVRTRVQPAARGSGFFRITRAGRKADIAARVQLETACKPADERA